MRIVCIDSASERFHAPGVITLSMACVRASRPVATLRPRGMPSVRSGSTNATTGMSCGSTATNLRLFFVSVIT